MSGFRCVRQGLPVVAALLSAAPARAQRCPARALAIGAAFVGAQGLAVGLRHGDWWQSRPRGFHAVWGGSASAGQDLLLHGAISYQLSRGAAAAWDWACAGRVTAGWLGAATAVAMSLPKELGDGIHENGFSGTDMTWSALGAALPALHRQWPATRVAAIKAWYWPSREYRDRTGRLPQLENDYAGQRFYLSLNPARHRGAGGWPDWLGVAVGHGVPHWIAAPPRHEWYVTLDVDLRALGVQNGWWPAVAGLLDQVHFPAPGVKITGGRLEAGFY